MREEQFRPSRERLHKAAAREFAQQLVEGPAGQQLNTSVHAEFAYVNGNLNESLRGYEIKFAEQPNPYYGLHVVLLCDELKEKTKLDAALTRIAKEGPRYRRKMTGEGRPELIALADLIAKDLVAGGKGEIDLAQAAAARKTADDADQMNFNYFLGRYLKLHGQENKAKSCWLECMKFIVTRDVGRTLAGMHLLEMGIPPEQYKELLQAPVNEQGR